MDKKSTRQASVMSENIIYNCHTHLFTHENIPDGYFPLWLVPTIRNRKIRRIISFIMKGIVPWTKHDKIHRYAAFIRAAYRENQEGNLTHLIGYYPLGTKFIVLPMDLAYMGAGVVMEDIDQQHLELAKLSMKNEYRDILIPFAHIDPRQPGAGKRLKILVEKGHFKGVKIYPTLGYRPDDAVLMSHIYPYMVEKNIPLLAHCSPGAVNSKDLPIDKAHAMADPENYKNVMEAFPELRICLGHFGGIDEWRRHINGPRTPGNPTWLSKIKRLIKTGIYPNLYTDISYTIFNFKENVPFLSILLQDPDIIDKVLFGSDYYMVESETYSEKRFSIDLRSVLGEKIFWKIANENPKRYLGE